MIKISDDPNDQRVYLQEFINSSRELLDDVEPQIIALEKSVASSGKVDNEVINSIFRLFHSLKGSAGFVNIHTIISVTHEAETLLEIFRNGSEKLNEAHVDLFCHASDFVRKVLDTVESQDSEDVHVNEAGEIVCALKNMITDIAKDYKADMAEIEDGRGKNASVEISEAGFTDFKSSDNFENLNLTITPEMIKKFCDESLELCEEAEIMLLAFEKVPDNLELATNAFRAIHSFKGNAGFFGFSDLEKASHMAESVLDGIRSKETAPDKITISELLAAVDFLRTNVKRLLNNEPFEPETNPMTTQGVAVSGSGGDAAEKIIVRADDRTSAKGGGIKIGETHSQKPVNASQQVIRVDIEKLDMLLDLVGELVISETMVAKNPDLKGLQIPRFEKAAIGLDKITRNIQEVALSMRMIPIAQTFHKMERLVRDLSLKAEKVVALEIAGEETEVDKTIIEQISDPLIHIIRNSVDHGLESSGARAAAGKEETGHIKLEAKHSAGEVWITVEDDGRGLDREKILKKAVEKNLVSEETAPGMKDEEVWKLIFEPGFSTAEKVTSISGRGVGMDVVKKNIEKMRGKIDIRTKSGHGSMIMLRIPLTLAIIEGMVIRVGSSHYTIPINSICESIKPKSEQITVNPDGMEIVRIRGELLPVIRIHELYDVNPDFDKLTDGLLIIVENNEKKCCLFADELIGQQQIVIKGLPAYLGHVQGISGCAILGGGDISIILDIGDLINAVETGNRLCVDSKNVKKVMQTA